MMQGAGAITSKAAYEICTLDAGPAAFSHPDLQRLHTSLAPGESRDVTDRFLRTDERWPYTDVRGPGANISPNMPNPPRASYLMQPADPIFAGPLLFIAPAQVRHSLGAAPAGQTPPDIWTVTAGPYAPTVYGRIRGFDGGLTDFVAYPTTSTTPVFGPAERDDLSQMIAWHFRK